MYNKIEFGEPCIDCGDLTEYRCWSCGRPLCLDCMGIVGLCCDCIGTGVDDSEMSDDTVEDNSLQLVRHTTGPVDWRIEDK